MTTIDVTPDNTNKLAYMMGRIFHPYLICIPTVFILLSDMPLGEAAKWALLVLSIILTPLILVSTYITNGASLNFLICRCGIYVAYRVCVVGLSHRPPQVWIKPLVS